MKRIAVITDKDILGTEGISNAPPRIAVRAFLMDEDGLIALSYMGKIDFYTIPGGGVEDGERKEAALLRELKEETGCECDILREIGFIEENRAQGDFTQISYYYFAKVRGEKGVPIFTQDEKDWATRVEWHTMTEACRLIGMPVHQNYQRRFIQKRDITIFEEAMKIVAKGG